MANSTNDGPSHDDYYDYTPPEDTTSPPPPKSPSPPPPKPSPSPPPKSSPPRPFPSSASPSPPVPEESYISPPPPRIPRGSPPPPKPHGRQPPPSSNDDSSPSSSSPPLPIVVGVSVGVVLASILIIALIVALCKRKEKKYDYDNHNQYYPNGYYGGKKGNDHDQYRINLAPGAGMNQGHGGWQQVPMSSPQPGQTPQTLSPAIGLNQGCFGYEELAVATEGFSPPHLLGQGGFGYVHKGVLPNNKEVAVKSLKSGSGQGEREFQAEVEIISRVHHRHLVSLVGYCLAGEKKLLVYEFVPNKTLEYHLHEPGLPTMEWPTRLKIAHGAAKGLAYLHEDCSPRIIHRDIKSANILLDFSYDAKVADFGLAKLSQDNNTHVSTRVMGTFGYLAPEYASSGKLTDKSDVFSFGVVLLELITGRPPLDMNSDSDESLVEWARPLCKSALETGDFSQLVDPRLENKFVHQEMASLVACAGASVRHSARRRPKMRQIVRALEGDVLLDDLSEVGKPGRVGSVVSSVGYSMEYDMQAYGRDLEKMRKLAFDTESGSSEFGYTSEYGHYPSSTSSDSSGVISQGKPLM